MSSEDRLCFGGMGARCVAVLWFGAVGSDRVDTRSTGPYGVLFENMNHFFILRGGGRGGAASYKFHGGNKSVVQLRVPPRHPRLVNFL